MFDYVDVKLILFIKISKHDVVGAAVFLIHFSCWQPLVMIH